MENLFVIEEFLICSDTFESLIYPQEDGLMCKIHNAFGSNITKHHNCLGCNLDNSTNHIFKFLEQEEIHSDLELSATTYILLIYLLIERIETIFEIIGLPEAYKKKHFDIFQKIKKWANFFKHPKAFVLCHHPEFYLENDPKFIAVRNNANIIIDNAFVFKYYSGDNNKKELYTKLANEKKVYVALPNIVLLTKELCEGLQNFVALIENNEVYRDILNDQTTIQDYFLEDIENNEK